MPLAQMKRAFSNELLESDYNIQMTKNTEEAFEDMCDFSTGFYQDGLNKGVKQGRVEGRAEGIGIGVERGKLEEQANIIKKLLRKLDPSQISSMLDIPLNEVEKIKRSIAQN